MQPDSSAAPAPAAYVDSRRIGEATVTLISEGLVPVPVAAVFPAPQAAWLRARGETDAQDRVATGQTVVHVRLGDASILVDPAFDDPASAWSRHFATKWPGIARGPGLEAGLATIGVQPDQITHVLITHAHDDHFAGVVAKRDGRLVARFPHARHLLGRGDWEGNPRLAQPDSDLATRLGAIARLGLLDLVDGDREVVPGIALLHAPGETPGHSIVRVASAGERFYALGDLFHHAGEVEHLDWHSPWVEPVAMRASRERLLAEAVPSQATVVFTHAPFPPWGRIVPAGAGYRFVAG